MTIFGRRLPCCGISFWAKLNLHGIKSAFDEALASGIKLRRSRSGLQEACATVWPGKVLDRFDLGASPVSESLVRSLHQRQFLGTKSNVIQVRGTGTGKTQASTWSIWSISLDRKSL
jgi:hypothetical protein